MASITSRSVQDAALIETKAFPIAANTANANVIDMGLNAAYPVTDSIGVKVSHTAATNANSKNINITLYHSNESTANFVVIPEIPKLVVAASGASTIAAGTDYTGYLPPSTRRYIRASATGEANGADSSDGSFTVQLMF